MLSTTQRRQTIRARILKELSGDSPDILNTVSSKFKRRVMHFIPAHKTEYLKNINELSKLADCIILDLEDSVPQHEKAQAYDNILAIYKSFPKHIEFCIRINHFDTLHFHNDLKILQKVKPDSILLPKINTQYDLIRIEEIIAALNVTSRIIPIIETLQGYHHKDEIISYKNVDTIVFGAEDFFADYSMRVRMRKGDIVDSYEDRERYLRIVHPLLISCAVYGVRFIDSVHTYIKVNDIQGNPQKHLEKECILMHNEGALGKLSIHPSQIEIIRDIYDIKLEEIIQALDKIKSFANRSVIVDEYGHMQDSPEILAARRIIIDALKYL